MDPDKGTKGRYLYEGTRSSRVCGEKENDHGLVTIKILQKNVKEKETKNLQKISTYTYLHGEKKETVTK